MRRGRPRRGARGIRVSVVVRALDEPLPQLGELGEGLGGRADVVDDDRFFFKSIGSLSVRGYRHLKARVIEYDRDHVPDSPR